MVYFSMILFTDEVSNVKSYDGYHTYSFFFWLYFLASTLGGGLLNGATFWCIMKNSALTTSVAGVLKSILQIFFGMFAFDRLAININTVVGIMLSLVAGTMFTYLEYTAKQTKVPTSMNDIDCEQQNQQSINPSFNTQENTTNSEKPFVYVSDETRVRRTSTD